MAKTPAVSVGKKAAVVKTTTKVGTGKRRLTLIPLIFHKFILALVSPI
jgi:hypothetical protein